MTEEKQELITFGRLLFNYRRELGLSQRKFANLVSTNEHSIDYITLSKIENDRIDLNSTSWDWLFSTIADMSQAKLEYLELIRRQTKVRKPDLNQPHIACCERT